MTFPQKLQEYRRAAQLSQEELAHRLGVSRQSVSKWEQGQSFPETEKLIELSSMLGVSMDSLLKAEDLPPMDDPEKQAAEVVPDTDNAGGKRNGRWVTVLLAVLLAAVTIALIAVLLRGEPVPPVVGEDTVPEEIQTGQQSQTDVSETPEVPDGGGSSDIVQEDTPENGFENQHLQSLQDWFFDFSREYRLDYMPVFSRENGAPTDAAEYLYWAYSINQEHWGDTNVGVMKKSYVEDTVQQYFAVLPGQHRTLFKSWDFDPKTELYTAWPESLREKPYDLLKSITVEDDCYTVRAVRYSVDYLPSAEDDARLRAALLSADFSQLQPVAEITVTFRLSYLNFVRPIFLAHETVYFE